MDTYGTQSGEHPFGEDCEDYIEAANSIANEYIDAEGKVMYIKGEPDPSRLSYLQMKEAFGCKEITKGGITFVAPFKESE